MSNVYFDVSADGCMFSSPEHWMIAVNLMSKD